VDDFRESPALEVTNLLVQAGADVRAFDPYQTENHCIGVSTIATLEEALVGAELILLLVNHTPLRVLDPRQIAALTPARQVLDAVNAWPVEAWLAAGFKVNRLGASTAMPLN
jgi:UDP-N-acetyl-D-mannosaminuronate dehydrogenase